MRLENHNRGQAGTIIVALAAIVVLIVAGSWPACATLGGNADSVQTDQSAMRGEMATATHSNFTIKRISTAQGVVINEYVSNSGTVFAVSWRGPRPPDLAQLFGSYFTEYQAAAAEPKPHRERRHLHIETTHIVVDGGGHMRSLWGRAYVPSLLPTGVTAEDIQ